MLPRWPAPRPALVGTTEHSVLGPRWVYDGCADPVAMHALATAILTGGHEAGLEVDTGSGAPQAEEPGMRVLGSGIPPAAVPAVGAVSATDGPDGTVVDLGGVQLVVRPAAGRSRAARRLDVETLTGTWPGVDVAGLARHRPARLSGHRRRTCPRGGAGAEDGRAGDDRAPGQVRREQPHSRPGRPPAPARRPGPARPSVSAPRW